jgi:hypothetical protein
VCTPVAVPHPLLVPARAQNYQNWIFVSVVSGGAAANALVKGLQGEWGKALYTRSIMTSIGQSVYKVRARGGAPRGGGGGGEGAASAVGVAFSACGGARAAATRHTHTRTRTHMPHARVPRAVPRAQDKDAIVNGVKKQVRGMLQYSNMAPGARVMEPMLNQPLSSFQFAFKIRVRVCVCERRMQGARRARVARACGGMGLRLPGRGVPGQPRTSWCGRRPTCGARACSAGAGRAPAAAPHRTAAALVTTRRRRA